MLQKILSNTKPDETILGRILQFYKVVVELEQRKEPDVETTYPYEIHKRGNTTLLIDLQCNQKFLDEFENNRSTRIKWPKDLYIGLNIIWETRSYRLFRYIIAFDDIKNIKVATEYIPCMVSSLSVDLKVADELNLSEEQVQAIEEAVKDMEAPFDTIIHALKTNISQGVELDTHLQLALSQKNPALSQIYSELKKITSSCVQANTLLTSFLLNTPIENRVDTVADEAIIQITPLDDSQRNVIANALNSRLSVVTGPPGCGKTQVILNIMANAILQNKKVLVASKNNKAVDNVKERFDNIDSLRYFLRFGTKEVLRTSTLPEILHLLQRIPSIQNCSENFEHFYNSYQEALKTIKESKAILEEGKFIKSQLPKLQLKIRDMESSIAQIDQAYQAKRVAYIANSNKSLFVSYDIRILNRYISELKIRKNTLAGKYSGVYRLWFNWFHRKKYAAEILNIIEGYSDDIKADIGTFSNKREISDFNNGNDIIELYTSLISNFDKIIRFVSTLVGKEKEYDQTRNVHNANLKVVDNELAQYQNRLIQIKKMESNLQQNILEKQNEIKSLSIALLNAFIEKNITVPNAQNALVDYKGYLPDSLPWKDNEVAIFLNKTRRFLDICRLNAVTSLSVKAAFPLSNEIFDMVIIDEASQCDIASVIPLILRTKQLVVIGDPMQLKHITKVKHEEESAIKKHLQLENSLYLKYSDQSLWDYSADRLKMASYNNQPFTLNCHYRCHPEIIGYSNTMFYERRMGIKLNICTSQMKTEIEPKGIVWVNVRGQQKGDSVNINECEAQKSIELAKALIVRYSNISIGIVTPFRHQAERINSLIPTHLHNSIVADTVHKFQGDEKDIMIYSLVVTDNSSEKKIRWIDYSVPNLVNVAVTRARYSLYIVGNKDYILRKSCANNPLGYLARYTHTNY